MCGQTAKDRHSAFPRGTSHIEDSDQTNSYTNKYVITNCVGRCTVELYFPNPCNFANQCHLSKFNNKVLTISVGKRK